MKGEVQHGGGEGSLGSLPASSTSCIGDDMLTSCFCCHAFPAWSSIFPPGWTFSHLSCELKRTLSPCFLLVGVFLSQPQKSSRDTAETRMLHCIHWGTTDVTLYPLGEHRWLHCIHKCKFARPWSHRLPWLNSVNYKPVRTIMNLKGLWGGRGWAETVGGG